MRFQAKRALGLNPGWSPSEESAVRIKGIDVESDNLTQLAACIRVTI